MKHHPARAAFNRRTVLGSLIGVGAAAQLGAAPVFSGGKPSSVEGAISRMIARARARDAALRTAFPFGKDDGVSPYVVSARHGAFLDVKSDENERALRVDRETAALQADAARGVLLPGVAADQAISAELGALPTSGPVREAILRQVAALRQLRSKASDTAPGVWRLPGGAEYYPLRLRCTTGSDRSPAQVDRQIGEAIALLSARADRLLRQESLTQGSVGARLRELRARSALYANDDAGRKAAVVHMNGALDRLRAHLLLWFNPPFEAQSSVRRMTPVEERAAKRGYREPRSGNEAGIYFPDLNAVRDRPAWTLTTVACHETIPGHLLQMGRQAAMAPPPSALQLRSAPGFAEGWAIYAESLADRMGLFSNTEQIGFIQSWLFRLARVRADIGLHVHRWSRAQAIRFLEETVGFELFFPFAVEVDRYCIEPAGFAGDALVALALRDAAPRASARMRLFHDHVLNHGPLSIEALAEIVPPR